MQRPRWAAVVLLLTGGESYGIGGEAVPAVRRSEIPTASAMFAGKADMTGDENGGRERETKSVNDVCCGGQPGPSAPGSYR